jgi:hypothetical protein
LVSASLSVVMKYLWVLMVTQFKMSATREASLTCTHPQRWQVLSRRFG